MGRRAEPVEPKVGEAGGAVRGSLHYAAQSLPRAKSRGGGMTGQWEKVPPLRCAPVGMTGGVGGKGRCFAAATPPQNTFLSLLLKKIAVIPTKPARYERAHGGTCRQAQNDGSRNDEGEVPPLRCAPVGMTGRRGREKRLDRYERARGGTGAKHGNARCAAYKIMNRES
ncbi:MAG: hypothetical protein LBK47_01895 [Prevotellaceae bacterium]|nr:hypothetical protein [Prevotellaceae bacterium]